MRRKIAYYIACVATALFMVLRIVAAIYPNVSLGFFSLEDGMIAVTLISMLIIAVLCFSKTAAPAATNGVTRSMSGWVATFCGALLIMSVVLDTFRWVIHGHIPPPNDFILNNIDRWTLILSLLCGSFAGIFMIVQGFNWMAGSARNSKVLSWLSLTPVLWMWFRLARYEISYASTIDISHSFYDFAALVTASLFFLQLARAITGVGAQSKNGLVIFALFTGITALSSAPLIFYSLAEGAPISSLLIALVDATVGFFAFAIAFAPIFKKEDPCTDSDRTIAWTTPAKDRQPLDPPFSVDDKLPVLDDVLRDTQADTAAESDDVSEKSTSPSVEDILAELNKPL